MKGWIGVDLDGTLAHWEHKEVFVPYEIGAPIELMVKRVRLWLIEGKEVRIFTARVCPQSAIDRDVDRTVAAIQAWCYEHIGIALPVTCVKDYGMIELWDDRAQGVAINTGMGWKETLIEQLIVTWAYKKEHQNNPLLALADLVKSEVMYALDPAVSEPARELVAQAYERGYNDGQKQK